MIVIWASYSAVESEKIIWLNVWNEFNLGLCFQENSIFSHIKSEQILLNWKLVTINLVRSQTWTIFWINSEWIIVFLEENSLKALLLDVRWKVESLIPKGLIERFKIINYYSSRISRLVKNILRKRF
jgi:hypothetical protein